MALFGSATSAETVPSASSSSNEIKTQIQGQISQELAMANATELVSKITQNCFDKCINQPEDRITTQQNSCVSSCLEKYMRSWNVISRTYVSRIQKEKAT